MKKLIKTLRIECLWNDWTLENGDPTFEGDILFYDNNYAIGIVKDIEEQQNKLVIGCIVEGYGVNLAKFDPSGIEIPRIYNIATFGEHYGGEFYTVDVLGFHSYGLADLYVKENKISREELKSLFTETKNYIEEIKQNCESYVSHLLENYTNADYEEFSQKITDVFSDEINCISDVEAEENAMEFISKLLGKSVITDVLSKSVETLKKENKEVTYDNLKETVELNLQNNPSSKYTQEELEELLNDLSNIVHEAVSIKQEKTNSDERTK